MEIPVGMKEVFSSPDETDEEKTCDKKEYMVYVNEQENTEKVFQSDDKDSCWFQSK